MWFKPQGLSFCSLLCLWSIGVCQTKSSDILSEGSQLCLLANHGSMFAQLFHNHLGSRRFWLKVRSSIPWLACVQGCSEMVFYNHFGSRRSWLQAHFSAPWQACNEGVLFQVFHNHFGSRLCWLKAPACSKSVWPSAPKLQLHKSTWMQNKNPLAHPFPSVNLKQAASWGAWQKILGHHPVVDHCTFGASHRGTCNGLDLLHQILPRIIPGFVRIDWTLSKMGKVVCFDGGEKEELPSLDCLLPQVNIEEEEVIHQLLEDQRLLQNKAPIVIQEQLHVNRHFQGQLHLQVVLLIWFGPCPKDFPQRPSEVSHLIAFSLQSRKGSCGWSKVGEHRQPHHGEFPSSLLDSILLLECLPNCMHCLLGLLTRRQHIDQHPEHWSRKYWSTPKCLQWNQSGYTETIDTPGSVSRKCLSAWAAKHASPCHVVALQGASSRKTFHGKVVVFALAQKTRLGMSPMRKVECLVIPIQVSLDCPKHTIITTSQRQPSPLPIHRVPIKVPSPCICSGPCPMPKSFKTSPHQSPKSSHCPHQIEGRTPPWKPAPMCQGILHQINSKIDSCSASVFLHACYGLLSPKLALQVSKAHPDHKSGFQSATHTNQRRPVDAIQVLLPSFAWTLEPPQEPHPHGCQLE